MDKVKVWGQLSKFKYPAIPGSFDQIQYNTIMGIDANGVVFRLKKMQTPSFRTCFDIFSYIRFTMTKIITSNIKGNASGIASALLTGDKTSIKPEIREKFIKSGTAHILAISGLHMSIVAGILFFCLKRLFLYIGCLVPKINARNLAAIITIPITFLYLALSGFSPSAIRAFIMTTLCLISIILGKKALSLRNVTIAASLILLFSPFSLFHVSFQLSFSAVVALISFYEWFYSKDKFGVIYQNKILLYFLMSLITTIIATISTAPISIATFNRFSFQNILGNLIAIPITSFLIAPFGIMAIILGKLTNIFTQVLTISINLLINSISCIAELPGSNIALHTPTTCILSGTIIGGLILCLLKTKLKYIGCVPILISLFSYIFIQKKPEMIFVPGEDNIFCYVKDGKLFSNSKQKGRTKINAIVKNLGLEDSIHSLDKDFKIPQMPYNKNRGIFIWKDGKKKQLSIKKHPVCPVYYTDIN